ncbi:hypothetical protein G9P44_000911 [Scheffersomyces stipitis]|nr:hypothetical protein G9P44_000911 [Scheffersomyces stipitis]
MSSDENSTTSNKRTRASGEALDFLLQEFEKNPNPSTEQRKDISSKTNMSEKAVRIWFQNRRAKLRKFERLNRLQTGGSSIHSSRSNSISNISPIHPNYGNQAIPIEINEKYCFVDCTSLSVGSWQRIKSGYHDERSLRNNLINLSPFTINSVMTSVDLLVILSKKNCEINYFFSAISNNSKILFRIFYPISSVATCSLLDNNITKENSELRVSLTHQPKFSVYFFNGINSQANQWSICDDFSEGQQVSQAYTSEGGTSIPHVLVGIKSSLQYLNSFIADNNNSTYSQFPTSVTPSFQQPFQEDNTSRNSNINNTNNTSNINTTKINNNNHDFFSTEDLLWDETSSLAPTNTNRSNTPLPFPQSSSGSISNGSHLRNAQMSGFSPLADFNSDTSPNSIGSTNSNQINVKNSSSHPPALQQHHSLQSVPQYQPHTSTFNSSANTPHSIYSRHSIPQHNSHSNIPETSSVDGYDVFNTANTPDFFTTLSGDGGQTPSNMLNHENSPSMNSQGHSNGVNSNTISIHAYTHQNNNHNDFLDSIQTFPSSHDFEFGLGGDLASNGETPLGGAFDGAPNGGNAAGNNNSSNNNNNATSGGTSSNVDSFIDFGSH